MNSEEEYWKKHWNKDLKTKEDGFNKIVARQILKNETLEQIHNKLAGTNTLLTIILVELSVILLFIVIFI